MKSKTITFNDGKIPGKSLKLDLEFLAQCRIGKRVWYVGMDFIAIDKKSFKENYVSRSEIIKAINQLYYWNNRRDYAQEKGSACGLTNQAILVLRTQFLGETNE